MRVAVETAPSATALAALWRELETRTAGPNFFRGWSWAGCLAAERFDAPVLLHLSDESGSPQGLALFNLRQGQLVLGDSGDPARDTPFTEDSGPLLADAAPPDALKTLFAAAWRVPGMRRLVLRGVAPEVIGAAGGIALRRQDRAAPYIDLLALRGTGQGYLDSLSANTRQQIRRAMRAAAASGPLGCTPAETLAEAEAALEELITLHQADWQARGKPGAFAAPFMRRFHAALLREAFPRGEIELLRVSAGPRLLGCLYNFRHRGRVYAYQSGFDRAGAGRHEKPGLVCHALAIEAALARGDAAYDFLAGEGRYKSSLANATRTLVWAELVPRRSALGLFARLRQAASGRGGAAGPAAGAGPAPD